MVTVGKSKIHGKGLFAKRFIPKDTVLGSLHTKRARKEGEHVLWITERKMFKVLCDFKYINHSKQPNVAYFDDLTVVAIRDISPGEELTHDYGEDWD